MISRTTERFRRAFAQLPPQVQRQARSAYQFFENNPQHPSLWFKQVHPIRPIFSVRVTRDYRALGAREGDELVWFWIGSHAEYDQMLGRL